MPALKRCDDIDQYNAKVAQGTQGPAWHTFFDVRADEPPDYCALPEEDYQAVLKAEGPMSNETKADKLKRYHDIVKQSRRGLLPFDFRIDQVPDW